MAGGARGPSSIKEIGFATSLLHSFNIRFSLLYIPVRLPLQIVSLLFNDRHARSDRL